MNAKTETGYKIILIDQRSEPSVTEQNVAGMNVKFYTSKNETAQNWMREIFHGISRMSKILFYLFICLFFREGKGGKKRGRETSMRGCLLRAPYW